MKLLQKLLANCQLRTLARKSIAGFKLREGMPIGVKVTLRKEKCMNSWINLLI